MHRGIDLRNQRSKELLKLGGGQKFFIFRGRGLPYEEGREFSRGRFIPLCILCI